MDHEARQTLAATLVGTAYGYLHRYKKIPFDKITLDLEALVCCGLGPQPWFVSISSKYHNKDGVEYYDIGIRTDGEPIAIRAVLQDSQLNTTFH